MYKVAGEQDDAAVNGTGGSGVGPFFADRAGLFDGTIGHVPGDSKLAVDRVYATWNNIADQPIWFSVGRRPSTGGVPTHLRQNNEKPGNSGVPALLVDYAFDGVTLGYAPDIDALPGAYAKLCYGRGFENGITTDAGNGLRDTDMFGINVVPYDTDAFRAEFQYNRGMNIFNVPVFVTGPNLNTPFASPSVNVGDIDWFGLDFLGKVKNVGIGHLNWFVDGALSVTRPNNNTVILPVDPARLSARGDIGTLRRPPLQSADRNQEGQDRLGDLRRRPLRHRRSPAPSSASNTTTAPRTGSPSLLRPTTCGPARSGPAATSTRGT